jgi:hypothetical protein
VAADESVLILINELVKLWSQPHGEDLRDQFGKAMDHGYRSEITWANRTDFLWEEHD